MYPHMRLLTCVVHTYFYTCIYIYIHIYIYIYIYLFIYLIDLSLYIYIYIHTHTYYVHMLSQCRLSRRILLARPLHNCSRTRRSLRPHKDHSNWTTEVAVFPARIIREEIRLIYFCSTNVDSRATTTREASTPGSIVRYNCTLKFTARTIKLQPVVWETLDHMTCSSCQSIGRLESHGSRNPSGFEDPIYSRTATSIPVEPLDYKSHSRSGLRRPSKLPRT